MRASVRIASLPRACRWLELGGGEVQDADVLDFLATAVVTLSAAEAHFAQGHQDEVDVDGDGKKDQVEGEHDGDSWVRVSGPPLSYDLLRLQNGVSELIGAVAHLSLEDAIPVTSKWIAALRAPPEAREGFAAFLCKRKPGWMQ